MSSANSSPTNTLFATDRSATPRCIWSRNDALTSGAEEDSPTIREILLIVLSTSFNAEDVLDGFRILGVDHYTGHKRLNSTFGAQHQPK